MRKLTGLIITATIALSSCTKEATPEVENKRELRSYTISTNMPYTVTLGYTGSNKNFIITRQPSNSCVSEINTENSTASYTYKPGTNFEGVDEVELQLGEKNNKIEKTILLRFTITD